MAIQVQITRITAFDPYSFVVAIFGFISIEIGELECLYLRE